MDLFLAKYKNLMLAETAAGATLVEEVLSQVRVAHAFGTQKRLAALYNLPNLRA